MSSSCFMYALKFCTGQGGGGGGAETALCRQPGAGAQLGTRGLLEQHFSCHAQDALAAAVAQKRRFADSLAAELNGVREAAGPLRAALSVAPRGIELPARAEQLPVPLYIALAQLLAARVRHHTLPNLHLSCFSSVKSCQRSA